MKNTLADFLEYCATYGIVLNKEQIAIAKDLFNMPIASGKTVLVSLLYAYDPVSQTVLNNMGLDWGLCQNTLKHTQISAVSPLQQIQP